LSKFYKELKELRESRKISLDEISERTKINVQYLQDIEKGAFEDIETPYLRLFLRAYAEEIGSDSQRALEQLDSYSGATQASIVQNNILNDSSNFNTISKFSNGLMSNKDLRRDYIIAGVFSVIFVFSIFIFQKIFDQESKAVVGGDGPVIIKTLTPLTYENLNKDFVPDHSSQELLSVKPPYFIKLKTAQQIAYTFKNDTLPPISHILNPNKELDLNPFVERSEIVFNATKGLTLFINATELKQISGYEFPLRLVFEPNPPSISIQRFKPIF
tara:strand:- start:356 stop:1174 length:819 start_codon:yes stop_codon:yes gene_type:complete